MEFTIIEDGVLPESVAGMLDEDPSMKIQCLVARSMWIEVDDPEWRNGVTYRVMYR